MAGFRKKLADAALELIAPTRCVGCEMPGELICDECRSELPWIEQRRACPVCGAAYGDLTCTGCEADWETRSMVCALGFTGAAPRMATCLKDYHELRLAPVNAVAILTALEEASFWSALDGRPRFDAGAIDAVCFVPATAEAYERRGYDHMELTARELARMLGLPLADVLAREKASDQRGLGRTGRAENLAGTFRVVDNVAGLRLLLVDDVVTTGATVREAARVLLARGAEPVTACSLVRVW
ncbi:ComF family protein [Paratractidigestivibacter sp.]|uniref:ComF family protein n=1 Tax=Paratractidigestivibacter sp. TaxID=2847316 RepID=UPI002ABE3254|nr:phosphoribosyltransferase family protein [Paratractidigestivibacter sp.]